jgi:hypothetical protein
VGAILDACAFLLSEYLQVYKAVRVLSFRYEGSEGCFLKVEQNLCYKRGLYLLKILAPHLCKIHGHKETWLSFAQ